MATCSECGASVHDDMGLPWELVNTHDGWRPKVQPSMTYRYTKARARLMTAAPDLAEALANCARILRDGVDVEDEEEHEDALTAANRALRKAGWRQ